MPAPTFRKNMPGGLGCKLQVLRQRLPQHLAAYAPWIVALALIPLSWMAIGEESAPPNIPAVDLATVPLFAEMTVDKPAMTLALSVEHPTVGAEYNVAGGGDDTSYNTGTEYLGYYDAEGCYTYNNRPTEVLAPGGQIADYKRFDRTGSADKRRCTNAFSGNFLNWASGSAIDMYRLALSGGDRSIDTPTLTILQRAMIPNGDPICMWRYGYYFPKKILRRDGGGTGAYWGAVPASMITDANDSDIHVLNTLNRIYFGTSRSPLPSSNRCDEDLRGFNLGFGVDYGARANDIPSTSARERATFRQDGIPEGLVYCAQRGEFCSFSGIKAVWYGSNQTWSITPAVNGIQCDTSKLGTPQGILWWVPVCYVGEYTGDWRPPAPAAEAAPGALNSDGFFYARVQVCNVDRAGVLQDSRNYNFCTQYPNGKFKPTGVIQKYSDQMRFAAFGYLLDQTRSRENGRYGGVLRVPMKYVGAKTYDISGRDNTPSGGNPHIEWDTNTGVFAANPDANASPPISGIINYLNRFGRSGTKPGVYKVYDPVGELHYEALRYLQGLQPSPAAIAKPITDVMADGFPYFTTWHDPYGDGRPNTGDYSCVKSNVLVIGDDGTHDGNRLPAADAAKNIPDIGYWRGIVQAFEKKAAGTSYIDGQGNTQSVSNPHTPNYAVPNDIQMSQIMGSAYWARTHDIRGTGWTEQPDKQRPGLRVKTFAFDVNEGGNQNNDAWRRNFNQLFMAAKYGGFETDPFNPGSKPYNTKGNPFQDQTGNFNDDVWQKTNDPGEAATYYVFNTAKPKPARDLLNAFDDIFSRGSVVTRSVAGGSMNTGRKLSTNPDSPSVIYSATFDTSNWSGDVVAEKIILNASQANAPVLGPPLWRAATQLGAPSAVTRKIFITQASSSTRSAVVGFTWATINDTLKGYMNRYNPSAAPDDMGRARVSYLRGDRSKEGDPFRVRGSLLGDIVNSNISYSGAPSKAAFTDAGYKAFSEQYAQRVPVVFAGANDGMLHAFNAKTGDELFAYIPSWLAPKLSALTDPGFAIDHQNYVDAPSVVADAQVANTGAATDWKTVLVSGTGGGGPGVFALDVSNPAQFDAANVMWEFTRADDPDIGQVVGTPKVMKIMTQAARVTDGTASTTTTPAKYRWFAVVGSGVNNYRPENGKNSPTGQPALFLLALDKPAGQAWSLGNNYFKVSLPINSMLARSNPTGLINFSALYGIQGEMTDIYMGDLHGNLWRLQFAGKETRDWNMGKLSFFNQGDTSTPTPIPLYIARTGDTVPKVQPIAAAPAILPGPIVGGVESFYVVVGTGKYLESRDSVSTTQQTVYAIYDNGTRATDGASRASATSVITGRSRLRAGTVDKDGRKVTVSAFQWGRPMADTQAARAGWYFDLPVTGERVDQAALDLGALTVAINSKIPGSTATGAASCANAMGGGNQYVLSIDNGAGTYVPSTLGLLGPPVLQASDGDARVSPSDSTGQRIRTVTLHRFTQAQGGIDSSAPPVTISETIGRLSWRQVFNYLDLKNASP
ncbi:pilus assembly protein [Verminephrobacter eiseniae]|uniref:pilus assembly protein n=1 Tax=Verminephrobacter eiseniae TaxID=364317 RepID=UPI0022376F89|nr:PilC/PilY family type IV pilus protein [Verminephrobacter eiseniae]MCW5230601.1 pilus assembly protein PilY [Verminephrobacter eiseniae]MCW5292334.1 pilus assembly protein PilY [Verminephrobacter eiseniae]MCW8183344.1 pilus assembly protein PilY [Verminephrobacter eiseniae]MCW8223088.1 pilus assembly protein PilY [Verminephrobacter eiseniae]MCW8234353.1 pilus assembly protein PilY [Verminephrobacter eiseniae]